MLTGRIAKDCPKPNAEFVGCGESSAIIWCVFCCNWRNDVVWLPLDFLPETHRVEQRRIQISNCPRNWHRQWCSEIGGSCGQITLLFRCERHRDRRVYTSASGEHVIDQGQQQILGTVVDKVRGLRMRVAQVRKSLTSVHATRLQKV